MAPRGKYRRYTPERQARALDLAIRALSRGWSISRFCYWSKVPKGTLLEWISEDDSTFDRYARAMSTKSVMIPDMAMDIVDRVINGRTVTRPDPNRPGEYVKVHEFLDPKAARVALTHFEFRVQRELKKIYEPTRQVNHKHQLDLSQYSDAEIDRRWEEMQEKAREQGLLPPPDDGA